MYLLYNLHPAWDKYTPSYIHYIHSKSIFSSIIFPYIVTDCSENWWQLKNKPTEDYAISIIPQTIAAYSCTLCRNVFCKVMIEVLFLWILSTNLYNLACSVIYVFLFVRSFCGIRILCDQLHLLTAIFLMWCSLHILLYMYWELHQEIHSSITGNKNNQPQWNRHPELMAAKPNCIAWSWHKSHGEVSIWFGNLTEV